MGTHQPSRIANRLTIKTVAVAMAAGLAAAYVLVVAVRWWMLSRLIADLPRSSLLVPTWEAALLPGLILTLVFLIADAARGRAAIIVALSGVSALMTCMVAVTTASTGPARRCQDNTVVTISRGITFLGLGCTRLIYRPELDTATLPTDTVLWLDTERDGRWVLDLRSDIVHKVDNDAVIGWEVPSRLR